MNGELELKIEKQYLKNLNKCPFCGSKDIEGSGKTNCDTDWYSNNIRCLNCEADWDDVYTISGMHIYDVGNQYDKVLKMQRDRLEELRVELRAEQISYGELAELRELAEFIEPGDVELLEAAGVPEFEGDNEQDA